LRLSYWIGVDMGAFGPDMPGFSIFFLVNDEIGRVQQGVFRMREMGQALGLQLVKKAAISSKTAAVHVIQEVIVFLVIDDFPGRQKANFLISGRMIKEQDDQKQDGDDEYAIAHSSLLKGRRPGLDRNAPG